MAVNYTSFIIYLAFNMEHKLVVNWEINYKLMKNRSKFGHIYVAFWGGKWDINARERYIYNTFNSQHNVWRESKHKNVRV